MWAVWWVGRFLIAFSVSNVCVCVCSCVVVLKEDFSNICVRYNPPEGDRGSTVVKVLCYKSEGRWSQLVSMDFSLT